MAAQSLANILAEKAYFFKNMTKRRKGYLFNGQKIELTGDNGNFYNWTYTAKNGMKTDAWRLKTDSQKLV